MSQLKENLTLMALLALFIKTLMSLPIHVSPPYAMVLAIRKHAAMVILPHLSHCKQTWCSDPEPYQDVIGIKMKLMF